MESLIRDDNIVNEDNSHRRYYHDCESGNRTKLERDLSMVREVEYR